MADKGRTTSESQSGGSQSTTYTPTPEEREMIKLRLERMQASQGQLLGLDQLLLSSAQTLAKGEPLPGMFGSVGQGISEESQQRIIEKSLRDIAPQLEKLGVGQSGPGAQLQFDAAKDIRVQAELQKQGERQNLLNLLQGFPATAQAGAADSSAILAQQLAGLRGISTTGRYTQSQSSIAPQQNRFTFF